MRKKLKVLIIDDDKIDSKYLATKLTKLDLDCKILLNSAQAIEFIAADAPDIVLTDLMMPQKNGLDILQDIKELNLKPIVIVITAYGSIKSAIDSMKAGAFDYILKPFSPEQFEASIKNAIQYKLFRDENYILHDGDSHIPGLGNIIGGSKIMQALFEELTKISKSDGNVMIYGESGTGKELIARNIHANSERKHNALIPVDCVALPENLLESELFGYEKGAFTGAESMRRGLIEYADKGTLFLDEICELAPNLQAKLLRVLQESEFRRIGGKELIKVNIRIISATNKKPEDAIKNGTLREDLFYRLSVIPVELPPLRERKEDIVILLDYFLNKFNDSENSIRKTFSPTAIDILTNYEWPGNIRELQNLVERVVSLVDGPVIKPIHLPEHMKISGHQKDKANHLSDLPFLDSKKKITENFEKEYFKNLLIKYHGNISKAAERAQISRRTLYRMINTYELQNYT